MTVTDLGRALHCDMSTSSILQGADSIEVHNGTCGKPAVRAFVWDGPDAVQDFSRVVTMLRCDACPIPAPLLGVSSHFGFREVSVREFAVLEVMCT